MTDILKKIFLRHWHVDMTKRIFFIMKILHTWQHQIFSWILIFVTVFQGTSWKPPIMAGTVILLHLARPVYLNFGLKVASQKNSLWKGQGQGRVKVKVNVYFSVDDKIACWNEMFKWLYSDFFHKNTKFKICRWSRHFEQNLSCLYLGYINLLNASCQ